MLGYNPNGREGPDKAGREEGYLFWIAWLGHQATQLFSNSDAHGTCARSRSAAPCATIAQTVERAAASSSSCSASRGVAHRPARSAARRADAKHRCRSRPRRSGRLLTMVALRAVVLRPAAVPVAVVRRPDPAQAEGLPVRGRVPRGDPARARGRRARRRRGGRQGAQEALDPQRQPHARRRSSSSASTRRSTRDARAILRQKTLLGETYVELTPGTPGEPTLPEGGRLPTRRSSETVELDEILGALDPHDARGVPALAAGRSAEGDQRPRPRPQRRVRQPAALRRTTARDLLEVLDAQERRAAAASSSNTGVVVRRADRERGRSCATSITTTDDVFDATASQQESARRDVPDLPDVPRRVAARRSRASSVLARHAPAGPRPAARRARPRPDAARRARAARPTCERFFRNLDPLIDASRHGPARAARDPRGLRAAARPSSSRSSAAQPDPRVARVPPAHDRRLLRQRRRRRWPTPSTSTTPAASATTCASSARSAPRARRSTPSA